MKTKLLLFSVLLIGMIACDSDKSTDGSAQLSLSLAAESQTVTKASSYDALLTNHVTVDSAKVLIRAIKFHRQEDDGTEGDSLDFETGTQVAYIALDGSPNEFSLSNIPVGMYDKVSFVIHKPEATETISDPDFMLSESGSDRFSVIVGGTYNGDSFVFKSRKSYKQRIPFETPLEITENTESINVTLTVDVQSWFVDEDGINLNPLLDDDESDIEDAMKDSFKAIEDKDKDGRQD